MSISANRLSKVLKKLKKIGNKPKILDVGGGMCPLGVATHIADFHLIPNH